MTASIMIVTYNRLELTKKTFDNLFENTDHPFNLVIVDNKSTDNTVEYLYSFCGDQLNNHKYLQSFKIIQNKENLGIAIARNQALQASSDEWLSTLDNDILLPKNWLGECIDILSKNSKYGMLGVNFENKQYPIVSSGEKKWQDKPRGNLGTACTVFNRSLHKMLGYFNMEYGKYGEEDADFGIRVRALGFKMGYLQENGIHLGEGKNDTGPYREFKTAAHQSNLKKFNENCVLYFAGKKPLYIPFKGI